MKTIVIANTAEAFLPLIERYEEPRRSLFIEAEHRLGDRALFWAGADKVVVTSYPANHTVYVGDRLGYAPLRNLYPSAPSPRLSLDMLLDPALSPRFYEVATPGSEITLVPYVASHELTQVVDTLTARGVRVHSSEIPTTAGLAAGRRFDRKSGFREMCTEWAPECDSLRLPFGRICSSKEEAAAEATSLREHGRFVVCKADQGESGIGLLWLRDASGWSLQARLDEEAAFECDPIVVEEVVTPPGSEAFVSPSVEVRVVPGGEARITYTCLQLCDGRGAFTGVMIGRDAVSGRWREAAERTALFIGGRLGRLGYVGHFDLDFVLDQDGVPYVVEGNSRRTGGTHAHEAAEFLVGHDYERRVTVFSRDDVHLPTHSTLEQVIDRAKDTLFPVSGEPRGVVPTVVSGIGHGTIGYLAIGSSHVDAATLEAAFLRSLS